jgi:hypothetical protein
MPVVVCVSVVKQTQYLWDLDNHDEPLTQRESPLSGLIFFTAASDLPPQPLVRQCCSNTCDLGYHRRPRILLTYRSDSGVALSLVVSGYQPLGVHNSLAYVVTSTVANHITTCLRCVQISHEMSAKVIDKRSRILCTAVSVTTFRFKSSSDIPQYSPS